jgi:O-antigen/teichoic acid export membrane protein
MQSTFVKHGALFGITKYFVVFIGLLRTMITAAILTKAQLGFLAAILLLFEYLTLLSPLGGIYAFNKSIVNLQATNKEISIDNDSVDSIYRLTAFVLILGLLISLTSIYLLSFYFSILPDNIENYILPIGIITILSVYRSYAVVHNRVWGKYNLIISMELVYATIYLSGIFLFLESTEYFLSSYFNVLIVSILMSIATSKFIPKLKLNFKTKIYSSNFFKLGIMLMAYNFLETFFWGVDRIFITLYLLPEQLADFHIAHTWSRGVMMAYMAITF